MLKSWMWFLTVAASLWIAGVKPAVAELEGAVTKINVGNAPAAVQKTLLREAAGAPLGKIEIVTEEGKTVHTAYVSIDGKVYEIRVAADGTLIGKNLTTKDDGLKVKFSDVPAAVQKTLTREANGARIETVEKEIANAKTTFEADVVIDGKTYEIEVAEDGILQEKKLKDAVEITVNFSECPAAVQKTLNREANGVKIDKVHKDTTHGRPVYEIDVKIDGRTYEILVAEDGLLLSKELDKVGGSAKAAVNVSVKVPEKVPPRKLGQEEE